MVLQFVRERFVLVAHSRGAALRLPIDKCKRRCPAKFVNEPVLKELAEKFCGRSKEDAEKIVASLRPVAKSVVRDRVVPVVVATNTVRADVPLFAKVEENSNYFRPIAQRELRKCVEFGERPEERFHLSFAASKEVKELLDRARQLMFSGDPAAVVFGKALAFSLSRHCPKERQRRREERKARRAVRVEKQALTKDWGRYVRTTTRDRVLERDGFQRSFVSKAYRTSNRGAAASAVR